MADKVQPVDIARAAELLAEHPDMPPGIAFQHAVIENAINNDDLTVAQAKEVYGSDVKEILGAEREGAHRSEPRAEEKSPEPRDERAGRCDMVLGSFGDPSQVVRTFKNFWTSTFQPELVSDRALLADPLFARYKSSQA
jgi:hypothetical protein